MGKVASIVPCGFQLSLGVCQCVCVLCDVCVCRPSGLA